MFVAVWDSCRTYYCRSFDLVWVNYEVPHFKSHNNLTILSSFHEYSIYFHLENVDLLVRV